MDNREEHLEALKDIRDIMDRSTRFLSLSGLSGIFAGVFALMGAAVAYYQMNINPLIKSSYINEQGRSKVLDMNEDLALFLIADAMVVLIASLLASWFFTRRNARKAGQQLLNSTSRRMMLNMMIPLVSGGFFCLVMLFHHVYWLIVPATLIFYGLALVNGGKYTLGEVRYLGLCEIALGVISAVYLGYGFFFWSVGFGLLHIGYGVVMYFKYERDKRQEA